MNKFFAGVVVSVCFVSMPFVSFADVAPDTTPPTITPPADQTFSTTTLPASPTLSLATAADDTDPNPTITYTPQTFQAGTTTVTWTATDASNNSSATTSNVVIVVPETANIAIRDGNTLIGPISVILPASNAAPVSIAPTGSSTTYSVPARSVLALLTTLDAATSSFDITDLQYFNSFNSFIINCIAVPSGAVSPDCYSWTYAVNGSFPFVGMDTNSLQNGDTAYVFFGSQFQVTTSTTSATTGESFSVTAQQYDPVTGAYTPLPNTVVGAVQFDTNFVATEFATSTTDASGNAKLTLSNSGTYAVGIQSSGYFPNTSVVIASSTPVASSTPQSGGGCACGGGGGSPTKSFDIPHALGYLASQQQADGSIGSALISDWAMIAFSSQPDSSTKAKLSNYVKTSNPVYSTVTDNERHAMALESMGVNPYSGTGRDYITPIVSAFNGTQIGDKDHISYDIFALIALEHAGYTSSDDIIQKEAAFVLSQQSVNGAWGGNPDTTAAAIQALGSLYDIAGVNAALGKASGYLVSTEQADAAWGNIDSLSWVQTAINAINETHPTPESVWKSSGGVLPTDALGNAQQTDGGVRLPSESAINRAWSTSYAVTAASGKSWVSLLQNFSKPATVSTSAGGAGGSVTKTATTTSATTTIQVSTNAPAVSTSTTATSSTPEISTSATATTTPTLLPKKIVHIKKIIKKIVSSPSPVVTSTSTTTPEPTSSNQTAAAAAPENPFTQFLHWFAHLF